MFLSIHAYLVHRSIQKGRGISKRLIFLSQMDIRYITLLLLFLDLAQGDPDSLGDAFAIVRIGL